MRICIVQYILLCLHQSEVRFRGVHKFLDYRKLLASFSGPLSYEYGRWMAASRPCLLTVFYLELISTKHCYLTCGHHPPSVLGRPVAPSGNQAEGTTLPRSVFKRAQSQKLSLPSALRVDHRYEIQQAVPKRTRGVGFVTVASFPTKATCFVVISLDDFLHVRSVTRSKHDV